MSEGLHPGVHPDLDALNALVEGALPEHERAECLAHLADCSHCRDIVFLAQDAARNEEPVAVPQPSPISPWRKFLKPMAVIPAVAAVIVAVLSFGLYRMTRSTEPPPQLTASANPPVPATAAPEIKEQSQPAPRQVSPRPVPETPPPPTTPPPQQEPASPLPAPAAQPVAAAAPPPPSQVAAPVQVAEGASVTGTITDPAGAAIASAQVELKNEQTGLTYSSTSGASGQYSIAGLPPGQYNLSVTSLGFKRSTHSGITLQPQQVARVDSLLQVGAAAESVTVTSEAALLKTESGEISHQADVASLNQLPVSAAGGANLPAVAGASPVYILPDKSSPVSAAAKDKLVAAVNSSGALFVSKNAGRTWTPVKATWKGTATRVSVANGMFVLTTSPASTWVSADGQHWSQARPPR